MNDNVSEVNQEAQENAEELTKKARRLKLLFIHEIDWMNKVVFEVHDFPELLSIRGHDVTVLDFPESGGSSRRMRIQQGLSRAWSQSSIRLASPPVFVGPRIGRWLFAVFAIPLIFKLVHQLKPDAIVTYAVPTSGWQAVVVARLLRIPIVYRAIDAVPELRPGLYRPLVVQAERVTCRFANYVSTHNEALRQRCITLGARPVRTHVLVPGVDLSRLHPAPPNRELAKRLGIEACDTVLVFMGTLFKFAQLDHLIRHLLPLLNADTRLKLLVIGDGEAAHDIRNLVESQALSKQVILVGMIEYPQLAEYLRLGSVGLLPFASKIVSHNALPNKVLQYLACGLPSVAVRLDGLTSVIPEGCGVIYVETLSELVSQAAAIARNPDELTQQRNRAARFSRENLRWDDKIVVFESFLNDVLDRRRISQ